MKKIKELIQRYEHRYPGWLFKWLVRKHWLFPEPKLISNRLYISESERMAFSSRDFEYEIRRRLIEELWEKISEMWVKFSYSPSSRSVEINSLESFESLQKIITIKVECRYNPHFTYSQIRDFIYEVDNRLMSDNQPVMKKAELAKTS